MHEDLALEELLTLKGGLLRELLPPHLDPLRPFKVENFGPLRKYTLGEAWPGTWVMLHHLLGTESGPPHCHPVAFQSTILLGSYLERVYHPTEEGCHVQDILRSEGSAHHIAAECIHKLIALPDEHCWTLVFAGPVVREWRHHPELV